MIGNYLLGEPIAGGGMGMVYCGTHTRLGRKVAIKVLLPNFAHNEKVRHRFEQEAYVQAQLKHPNIVQVSDMVVEGRNLALVMELIEGPSLETVGLESFIQLAAGAEHTCGIKKDGEVSCWGANDKDQSTPPAGVRFKTR